MCLWEILRFGRILNFRVKLGGFFILGLLDEIDVQEPFA